MLNPAASMIVLCYLPVRLDLRHPHQICMSQKADVGQSSTKPLAIASRDHRGPSGAMRPWAGVARPRRTEMPSRALHMTARTHRRCRHLHHHPLPYLHLLLRRLHITPHSAMARATVIAVRVVMAAVTTPSSSRMAPFAVVCITIARIPAMSDGDHLDNATVGMWKLVFAKMNIPVLD